MEVVGFMTHLLYLEERTPSTHQIGGWVGPRVSLDTVGKRKILPLPVIEPHCPAHSLVTILTELSWIHNSLIKNQIRICIPTFGTESNLKFVQKPFGSVKDETCRQSKTFLLCFLLCTLCKEV
jgi:hypothetical protein